jgi:hypothetical protein
MNESLVEFCTIIILFNVVIFSFLIFVLPNKNIAISFLFAQIFLFFIALKLYYIGACWALFILNNAILSAICDKNKTERLQNTTQQTKITEHRILCGILWMLIFVASFSILFWNTQFTSFVFHKFVFSSSSSNNYSSYIIYPLVFFVFISIIGCMRNIQMQTSKIDK